MPARANDGRQLPRAHQRRGDGLAHGRGDSRPAPHAVVLHAQRKRVEDLPLHVGDGAAQSVARFRDIEGDQTRASVNDGVMHFGMGCFKAIRNPIGHLPDDAHEMTEQEALEQLAAWSLLARWVDRAVVVRDEEGEAFDYAAERLAGD